MREGRAGGGLAGAACCRPSRTTRALRPRPAPPTQHVLLPLELLPLLLLRPPLLLQHARWPPGRRHGRQWAARGRPRAGALPRPARHAPSPPPCACPPAPSPTPPAPPPGRGSAPPGRPAARQPSEARDAGAAGARAAKVGTSRFGAARPRRHRGQQPAAAASTPARRCTCVLFSRLTISFSRRCTCVFLTSLSLWKPTWGRGEGGGGRGADGGRMGGWVGMGRGRMGGGWVGGWGWVGDNGVVVAVCMCVGGGARDGGRGVERKSGGCVRCGPRLRSQQQAQRQQRIDRLGAGARGCAPAPPPCHRSCAGWRRACRRSPGCWSCCPAHAHVHTASRWAGSGARA